MARGAPREPADRRHALVDTRAERVTMLRMTDIDHANDIERILILALREAAFRAFIDNPTRYGAPAVRFLRVSQRYV